VDLDASMEDLDRSGEVPEVEDSFESGEFVGGESMEED
jgi:hypothetical protein